MGSKLFFGIGFYTFVTGIMKTHTVPGTIDIYIYIGIADAAPLAFDNTTVLSSWTSYIMYVCMMHENSFKAKIVRKCHAVVMRCCLCAPAGVAMDVFTQQAKSTEYRTITSHMLKLHELNVIT